MRPCLSPEREKERWREFPLSPPSLLSALIGTDPPRGTSQQCEPSTAAAVSEGVRHIVSTQGTRVRVSEGSSSLDCEHVCGIGVKQLMNKKQLAKGKAAGIKHSFFECLRKADIILGQP
ncbi:hypothetical protein Baya_2681 [Bagarius yarrelli]|uniref:Uncharacterized protein n=1 Tax=Bagarius yarrelli TaxID=175774 RepID=A0A556VY68_BAGYA|nr:hypothetical protein Baya_2681 [Bagarius yarrelli]